MQRVLPTLRTFLRWKIHKLQFSIDSVVAVTVKITQFRDFPTNESPSPVSETSPVQIGCVSFSRFVFCCDVASGGGGGGGGGGWRSAKKT